MIITGDVREQLALLPADHFHCVVTSPPYWALRDYGVEGQLGLEPTVQEYVSNMVDVFREVRRVLRPDGVCWVNIGDTYNAGTGGNRKPNPTAACGNWTNIGMGDVRCDAPGFKVKDRIGVPHRLVFGLQDDGWYWRDEVIWHKPAPMPESVKDRTTKAHEFIFMLSKSPRYFYDVIAASESASKGNAGSRFDTGKTATHGQERSQNGERVDSGSRQPRSVWKIASAPLKAAHFAAYPPELVRRCLIGSVSEKGCCPTCGAPWVRVTEKQRRATRPGVESKVYSTVPVNEESPLRSHSGDICGNRDPQRHVTETITTGWRQSCKCEAHEPVPCRVLDPFHGAGTTMKVCERLGLDYVGTELNPEYVQISLARDTVKFPHEKAKKRRRKSSVIQKPLNFESDL